MNPVGFCNNPGVGIFKSVACPIHPLGAMHYMLLFVMALFGTGCAAASTAATDADAPAGTMIVVEGMLSMRGHEPFTTLVLETPQRNTYVLNLDDMQQEALEYGTPMRARVSGILYQDEWNGRPYAHLRVTSIFDLESVEDAN